MSYPPSTRILIYSALAPVSTIASRSHGNPVLESDRNIPRDRISAGRPTREKRRPGPREVGYDPLRSCIPWTREIDLPMPSVGDHRSRLFLQNGTEDVEEAGG